MYELSSLDKAIKDAVSVIAETLPMVVLIDNEDYDEIHQWLTDNNITYTVRFIQDFTCIEFVESNDAFWCKLVYGKGRV